MHLDGWNMLRLHWFCLEWLRVVMLRDDEVADVEIGMRWISRLTE
jgi:hypothetical protein